MTAPANKFGDQGRVAELRLDSDLTNPSDELNTPGDEQRSQHDLQALETNQEAGIPLYSDLRCPGFSLWEMHHLQLPRRS